MAWAGAMRNNARMAVERRGLMNRLTSGMSGWGNATNCHQNRTIGGLNLLAHINEMMRCIGIDSVEIVARKLH